MMSFAAVCFLALTTIHCFHTSSADDSVVVGQFCSVNADCVPGAHCSQGRCGCLSTHVAIGNFCWKKVSPEESGCTYDKQCEAMWPDTRCQSSTCKCPPMTQPSSTREGTVCHVLGECPTNGRNSLLYNRNTATPSRCSLFDEQSLPGHFIGCDEFPEVHDCIGGFCCPTRALTCIQPMDAGDSTNETSATVRWYHDPVSHSCKSFSYSGFGGNSNNFRTEQHCETYCIVSRCSRGQPQTVPASQEQTQDQRSLCTTSADSCESEQFKCAQVDGGLQQCCPTREFICSEWGGVQSELFDLQLATGRLPYSAGSHRLGQMPTTRWYWDRSRNACFPFAFFGQGGNFNNFLTKDHCYDFCSAALCAAGLPLRSLTGSLVFCNTSTRCPSAHTCQHGVCCPVATDLCNLPRREGVSCHVPASRRFWYNATSLRCQAFVYKGCHGNSNSFLTIDSCYSACGGVQDEVRCPRGDALKTGKVLKRCSMNRDENECPANYQCYFDGHTYGCCPTAESICMLHPDDGVACDQTTSLRWFYDDLTNTCLSFLFRGCGGNANNFPVQQMCTEYCSRPELSCPSGGSFHRNSNGEIVECHSNAQCPSSYECLKPMLQAVGDVRYCCPKRKDICEQRPDEGDDCGQSVLRYFFNSTTQQCQPFSVLGCGGNSNNFASMEVCYSFCLSTACAVSETVFISPSTGVALDCSQTPCPHDYSCVRDSWNTSRMVCCGTAHRDVCPDGFLPFISPRSLHPMTCQSSRPNVCPIGFHCLSRTTRRHHYCCREAKSAGSCPFGSRLVRMRTGDPFACNSDSHCPERAICHKFSDFQSGVCCKYVYKDIRPIHDAGGAPMELPDCPATHEVDVSFLTGVPCSPLSSQPCTSSSAFCTFSEKRKRFVCCRKLRAGLSLSPVTCLSRANEGSRKVFCTAEVSCPSSHYCVRRDSDRSGFCCPFSHDEEGVTPRTVMEGSCPMDSTPLVQSDIDGPQLCNAEQHCPYPYQCFESHHDSTVGICCLYTMITKGLHVERRPYSDGSYSCASTSCRSPFRCIRGRCVLEKALICNNAMDNGVRCRSSEASIRYFYDVVTLSCRQFVYYGCSGNANNFPDESECEAACRTSPLTTTVAYPMIAYELRCPAPFSNPTNWPKICKSEKDSSCDGTCISLSNGISVCCTTPSSPSRPSNSELCGTGFAPVIHGPEEGLSHCSTDEDCDGGICHFSAVIMAKICCTNVQRLPSKVECSASQPCKGQSVCFDGRCVCRPGQVQFRRTCYWKCPPKYKNVNGVCIVGGSFNQRA